ncbi:tRNA(Met) cytidine acetyltransferase TmcA [Kistimonas asteriae]|uniref:tRNA(Met) cytidine acetyltransferase TmcA n=1 Tax=Kistimonas asteriae TaxID=517724 RepID=UPI001BADAA34
MALADSFETLINNLIDQARLSKQRRALVLSGSHQWCLAHATTAIASFDDPLWISNTSGNRNTTHFKPGQTQQLLGTEGNAVIIDAHSGFNPNALGAASGIIRAGGLLILLCQPLEDWHRHNDPEYRAILSHGCAPEDIRGHYLSRMVRLIKASSHTTTVEEGLPFPSLPVYETPTTDTLPDTDNLCRTDDQRKAVEAIVRVATGHRRRPLVITADRGRGKSASLGIAAAQLLQQGAGPVLVTAPQPEAVKPLFDQAARLLPDADIRRHRIQYNETTLHFVAPDDLAQNPQEATLVMVDEAAAIPASLLSKLLKQHARIVFSSTIHGYEGSGRGFAIRFRETLDRITPKWRHLTLNTPIRWANNDPVEAFTFQLLQLNASPAPDAMIVESANGQDSIVKLSQAQLAQDEALLNELFGLLVTAHYQTTPRDLQMLLDSPSLSIYVLYRGAHIAGTVLSVMEGGFSKALAQAIWLGERRLRGHLIPQSLANHAGMPEAAELTGERIMRIAIHPALRRQGLGKQLLETVIADCQRKNRDFIASSFGATPALLNFWQASGLTPLRLGSTRDTASGEHSALVMLPLSEAASSLHTLARKRFIQQLPLLMSDSLRDIETSLVAALLSETSHSTEIEHDHLTEQDWLDSVSFAYSNRTYDGCILAIEKMLLKALRRNPALIAPDTLTLLVRKILQKDNWQEVANQCQLSGEKAVVAQLRRAVGQLIELHLPECPTPVREKLQPLLNRRPN